MRRNRLAGAAAAAVLWTMGSEDQELAIAGERALTSHGDRLCAITDVGRIRERNEDAVYAPEDGAFLIVADGLGGLPAGHVASTCAVDATARSLAEAVRRDGSDAQWWEESMRAAFDEAQRAVLAAGKENPDCLGMATTLVAAVPRERSLFLLHVGDVRAYRLGEGGLERLTTDHSVIGELVAAGQLDEEEGRLHPDRNVVTQVVGADEGFAADFTHSELEAGDIVLLCSDGLWETFDAPRLEEVLGGKGSAKTLAQALVDHALDAGGHDNISAVVYKHGRR